MTSRILASLCVLALVAGCQTTAKDKPEAKAPAPKISEAEKKRQEARFVKDIHRALDEGKIKSADSLVARLRFISPQSQEANLAQGEIYFRLGRYSLAADRFAKLVRDKALLPRAHQGLGLAQLRLKRFESAKKSLDEAVAADPELWRAWNGLGYYYDSRKDWKQSEVHYSRALKLRRDKPTLFNNLGFSKMMQGKHEAAIGDFKEALRRDPNLQTTRMNIRLAQAWQGRYVQAIAGATKRELPEVLNNVGYVAMLKGEYARAEAFFSRAMELSPSFNETAASNLQKLEAFKLHASTAQKARRPAPRSGTPKKR